jgi:uncharacterized protein
VLARALSGRGDSDATPEVAERMAREAPPWPTAREIDTTQQPELAYSRAASALG